jgi:hypothetical protein
MRKIYLYIAVLGFLLFLSCEKKSDPISNDFQRKWYSINGNLTINSNNTFEYIRFNSISNSISKGKWKIINDTLVLNSFEPKGCFFLENFVLDPPKRIVTNNNPNYKKTIKGKDCMPNSGYVNFRNEKFYIEDSLLISKTSPYNLYNKKLNKFYNFKKTTYIK